jgi:uncharacterized protein (DUF1684 family)
LSLFDEAGNAATVATVDSTPFVPDSKPFVSGRRRILSLMKRMFVVALLFLACNKPVETAQKSDGPDKYRTEIDQWHQKRSAGLMKDDGWLTLVGLQWLNEGENKIAIPTNGGTVKLAKGVVTIAPNASLTIAGKPIAQPTTLVDDSNEKGPTYVQSGTTKFNVIKRGDKFALRVRDTGSEARKNFKGLEYFPADPKWRVEARFEPFNPPHKIPITNVLGMTSDEVAPGELVFDVDGKEVRVVPILEQGETDYFLIFKDATAGKETYSAARYVYAPPAKNGKTVIDFNKAYNPPCAFTPFATCPLPPPQNKLPFRIEAGEKKYAGGHA